MEPQFLHLPHGDISLYLIKLLQGSVNIMQGNISCSSWPHGKLTVKGNIIVVVIITIMRSV